MIIFNAYFQICINQSRPPLSLAQLTKAVVILPMDHLWIGLTIKNKLRWSTLLSHLSLHIIGVIYTANLLTTHWVRHPLSEIVEFPTSLVSAIQHRDKKSIFYLGYQKYQPEGYAL